MTEFVTVSHSVSARKCEWAFTIRALVYVVEKDDIIRPSKEANGHCSEESLNLYWQNRCKVKKSKRETFVYLILFHVIWICDVRCMTKKIY